VKAALGLVLGVACAGVIACGGTMQKAAAPAPAAAGASEATPMPAGGPREQIDALDQQIARDLASMSLERPAVVPGSEPTTMSSGTTPPPACPPPRSTSCQDTCNLAQSICTNATSICRIANTDLAGTDTYANEKCQSGTASCQAAQQRCCGCT